MHDDAKAWMAISQTASSNRVLRRIADALGVPVSSFSDKVTIASSKDGPFGPEETAVLAIVRSYLKRTNPAVRDRFVAEVQTMIELPPA